MLLLYLRELSHITYRRGIIMNTENTEQKYSADAHTNAILTTFYCLREENDKKAVSAEEKYKPLTENQKRIFSAIADNDISEYLVKFQETNNYEYTKLASAVLIDC